LIKHDLFNILLLPAACCKGVKIGLKIRRRLRGGDYGVTDREARTRMDIDQTPFSTPPEEFPWVLFMPFRGVIVFVRH
jgi:hypothetical protein